MGDTGKHQKFIEFYLTELLNHVKNTSEHRFQPAEFSAIKKTLVFLSHSQNPTDRIETLKKVPVLNSLYEFFTLVLNRFQDPSYRKSHMMASIEVDSEKVSQMFATIFQSQTLRNDLVKQLPAIGITLQFKLTQNEPSDVLPADEVKIPAAATKTLEQTQPEEFKRVGDMLGFLTNRTKKFMNGVKDTSVPLAEKEPAGTAPVSALSELKASVKLNLQDVLSAMSRLEASPGRAGSIIELADAIGTLKKTARIHEVMSVYEILRRIEKTLNDVADRVDDKTTSVDESSMKALDNIFRTFHEWTRSPESVSAEGLETSLRSPVAEFHKYLSPAAPAEIKTEPGVESAAPVSETLDLNRIVIAKGSVNADNFAIFKDESQYYLNSIDAILSHFRDADPFMALKEIDQSVRAINTASRMIHLQFVNDLCGAMIRSVETVINKKIQLPDEFIMIYKTALAYFRDLLNIRPIALQDWQRLITQLVDSEKTIRELSEKPAEPVKPVKQEIKTSITEQVMPQAVYSDNGLLWIDDIQNVILSFFDSGAVMPVKATVRKEEERISAADLKSFIAEDLITPVPEEIPAEPVKEALKPSVEETIKDTRIPSADLDLLAIMINPSADLTKIKIPTFIDRLNSDPENIPEINAQQVKRSLKKKQSLSDDGASVKSASDHTKKTATKAEKIPGERLQTTIQRIRLHEHKFADVDAELLEIFNQESESYFRLFDKSIKRLQSNLKDESALKDIERVSHSIKSSARMLGFEKISGMAACVEVITERYFEKEVSFDSQLLALFEDIGTTLKNLYKTEQVDITTIAERLIQLEKTLAVPGLFTRYILGEEQKTVEPEDTAQASSAVIEPAEPVVSTAPAKKEILPAAGEISGSYFDKLNVDTEIIDIFREEADTYFKLFESALKRLKSDPRKKDGIRDIEKSAHSLRSSSRMIGLEKISNLAKPVEVIAEHVSKNALQLDEALLGLIEEAINRLRTLSDGKDSDIQPLLDRLAAVESSVPESSSLPPVQETENLSSGLSVLNEEHSAETDVKKVPAVKKSRTKKQTIQPFSDIAFNDDPILKHAVNIQDNLLDEMFTNSKNQKTD